MMITNNCLVFLRRLQQRFVLNRQKPPDLQNLDIQVPLVRLHNFKTSTRLGTHDLQDYSRLHIFAHHAPSPLSPSISQPPETD
jgi:hypothetical protein